MGKEQTLQGKAIVFDLPSGKRQLAAVRRGGMIADGQNRALMEIHLDGSEPLEKVRQSLARLGAVAAAENLEYRHGVLSVYLPLSSGLEAVRTPGVATVRTVHAPRVNIGAVTSEGARVIQSDQVNAGGISGQGITIGVISDSFNVNTVSPTAFDDVNSGDLPNAGVASGTPGLKFLIEGNTGLTDEGRALAQIAYDVAPGASFCFATGALGAAAAASNIRTLRINPACLADVILDDVTYVTEPWFSEGQISQAIDDVATGSTFAGNPVAYFSAAGSSGGTGYSAAINMIGSAAALALTAQPVDLTTIPPSLDTSGGFQNFNPNPNGPPAIAQAVTWIDPIPGDVQEVTMQWDDPFDLAPGGITTELDLLVFDSTGKFLTAFNQDTFASNEPVQDMFLTGPGTYYFAISRTAQGTQQATQVRWLAPGAYEFFGDYIGLNNPTIVGHNGAANAISVGAYLFDTQSNPGQYTPALENYSSAGPVTIVLDTSGNRLPVPVILRKPDIAAPDCVINTFLFSSPVTVFNGNAPSGLLCGTSAAAAHAGGAAALLLQAAGGSGSLAPADVKRKLQESAGNHDLDPFFSQVSLAAQGSSVTVSAAGSSSPPDVGMSTPNFFSVSFGAAGAGQTLTGLTIDLTTAETGLIFNTSSDDGGYPFTVGNGSPGAPSSLTEELSPDGRLLSLSFTGFVSGSFLNFGIAPSASEIPARGSTADLLAGAAVTATLSDGTVLTGTFINQTGTGYSGNDGFGLINAVLGVAAK